MKTLKKEYTIIWVLMILLTLANFILEGGSFSAKLLAFIIYNFMLLKFFLIIYYYMDLRLMNLKWKIILIGFILLIYIILLLKITL